MSDKELEEYIRTIEPNFDSHIEKGTIEMSNEYYNLLEERMARLINENQELKCQIEEYKRLGFKHLNDKCTKLENQQKEFIEYLEEEITRKNHRWEQLANQKNRNEDALLRLDVKIEEDEMILSKYKELGGKNER